MSVLVQVMTWCCWATSHSLNQCWPRPMMPYGVTRPQGVNDGIAAYRCKQWCHWLRGSGQWHVTLTHWPLGDVTVNLNVYFSNTSYTTVALALVIWMPQNITHEKSTYVQTMAWCRQATWANINPDLCCYMVSLGHNELMRLCSRFSNRTFHLVVIVGTYYTDITSFFSCYCKSFNSLDPGIFEWNFR